MTKKRQKTALDLAHALKRYSEMEPAAAFEALNDEWPHEIAVIVGDVLWAEIELRSEKQIMRDVRALLKNGVATRETVNELALAKSAGRRPAIRKS